jgi:hypothetical protein
VEWAGHPNWYFLISKFSIPCLTGHPMVPPAVFLSDFFEGDGRERLLSAGVSLPVETGPDTVYNDLLLKPLFSFAGKGIQFEPTQGQLEAIPSAKRAGFIIQSVSILFPPSQRLADLHRQRSGSSTSGRMVVALPRSCLWSGLAGAG